MTRITTTPLAVSEDYRDALVAARRAKNWLFLLLLLFLLTQITVFFLVKYTDVIKISATGEATTRYPTGVDAKGDADVGADDDDDVETPTTGLSPTTGESPTTTESPTTGEAPAPSLMAVAAADGARADASVTLETASVTNRVWPWVINSIVYLGTIFSILMAVVILLIVLIMLVGRFPGGGMLPSTSSFVWMALLALLLFPWQLCYGPETSGSAGSYSAYAANPDDDFRVPGALYTWGELRRDAKFENSPLNHAVQKWARFAGFPLLSLFILFAVQAKSGRAVKIALGEADVRVDVATDV